MTIEPLSPKFLDAVAELEKRAGDVGWSRAQFEKELHLKMARFFVLTLDNRVQGFGGYWNVDGEAQMTNLVIDPAQRRKGLGRKLLRHLMDLARQENCRHSTLEVRQNNQAAQQLYLDAGFAVTGRRPKVYNNPVEDAILMEKPF